MPALFRQSRASTDYTRVLLATLKFLGNCPCVRCLIEKAQIIQMGSKLDLHRRCRKRRIDSSPQQISVRDARRQIFQFGRPVNSDIIDNIVGIHSGVPITVRCLYCSMYLSDYLLFLQNAFSSRLLPFGVNFYSMLVVDLLHEFELGVWKAILTHLIRILYAKGEDAVGLMNSR